MATIGSLVVSLIANTSLFDSGLKKGNTSLKGFVSQIADTQRMVVGFAQSLMAAAGIAGVGYLVKQTMESIDATAKMSDRLNMATEDLIALQHAAKMSGMDTETMNKSLETFVRRIGEVKAGGGQAAATFKLLGLSASQLSTGNQVDNLKLIADRINQLPTAADKAAAAFDLFGRQGKQMLNLLQGGSAGIEEFRRDAEKLGITFSRFDAAKVEVAEDALKRTKEALIGVAQTAVIEAAPSIAAVADKFTEIATSAEDMSGKIKGSLYGVTYGFALLGNMINVVEGTMKSVAAVIMDVVTIAVSGFGSLLDFVESTYNKIVDLQNKLADTSVGKKFGMGKMSKADLTSGVDAYSDAFNKVSSDLWAGAGKAFTDLPTGKVDDWFADLDKRTASIKNNLQASAKARADTAGEIPVLGSIEAQKKIQESFNKLDIERSLIGKTSNERQRATEIERLQIEADKAYGEGTKKNIEVVEAFRQKIIDLQEALRGPGIFNQKIVDWADDATNVFSKLGDIATKTFDDIADALTQMINTGKADFRSLLLSVCEDIQKMVIKYMMAKAMMSMGFGDMMTPGSVSTSGGSGMLGSIISGALGLFSGGIGGSGVGLAGSGVAPTGYLGETGVGMADTWVNAGAGGWAKGGVFDAGNIVPFAAGDIFDRPTGFPMANGNIGMLGEAGPEAIMPLARGSDGRLGVKSGSSGKTIHQHITINTPDANSFRKSKSQISREMKKMIS